MAESSSLFSGGSKSRSVTHVSSDAIRSAVTLVGSHGSSPSTGASHVDSSSRYASCSDKPPSVNPVTTGAAATSGTATKRLIAASRTVDSRLLKSFKIFSTDIAVSRPLVAAPAALSTALGNCSASQSASASASIAPSVDAIKRPSGLRTRSAGMDDTASSAASFSASSTST